MTDRGFGLFTTGAKLDSSASNGEDGFVVFSRLIPIILAAAFGASCNCGGAVKPVEEAGVPEAGADAGTSEAVKERVVDLVQAGRALEAGDAAAAAGFMPDELEAPEALLVAARIAAALGEHDQAIARYEALAGAMTELEPLRLPGLARSLAAAGKHARAVDTARALLDIDHGLDAGELTRLAEDRSQWLVETGRADEAVQVLIAARKQARRDRDKDRLGIALAGAYDAAGKPQKARDVLRPIALDAASGKAMRDALEAYEELGLELKLTPKQRVERAERLAGYRSWDAAAKMVEPLTASDGKSKLHQEARWLEARIMFKRRRHYKEAIAKLDPIIAAKGKHADEAMFLRARALSRLDRDDEAIAAYRAFAKKTRRAGRAAEARFLAGRLEYYLGRHEQALARLEELVGSGSGPGADKKKKKTKKVKKKSPLTPGRVRDAHFLAGMSALLEGEAKRAEPHFQAASEGSKSAEAIERNTYWYAVARLDAGRKDGADLLRRICGEDPTSWYAALAGRRLGDAGKDALACAAPPVLDEPAPDADAGAPAEPKALEELSPLAALLARAGLFAEAAAALKRAEQSKAVEAESRDWIEAYNRIDAPHLAVRRASRGLAWPPPADQLWRARAAYPIPFAGLTAAVEDERGLPTHLIPSIARKESLFDPRAVSSVGALGMMQMMPHTYEVNRVRADLPPRAEGEIPGPQKSIRAAGCELEALLARFDGSLPLAIMAYNGGAAAVSRWLERSGDLPIDVFVEKGGFAQTRNYVRRVFKNIVRYRQLYGLPLPELPLTAKRPAAPGDPDAGIDQQAGADPADASSI
jgi:soluble lytic murein transglycosylase